jgi:urease subunit beta
MYTSNKVTIYDRANFEGNKKELDEGEYNIFDLGSGENNLTSLTVPAGMKVTLYEYEDFQGRSKTYTGNASLNGDDFNNKASSLKVERIAMTPGQIVITNPEPIELNAGRPTIKLRVINQGDRPIQVGSHFHFYEVNTGLHFDREKTKKMRLNITAGTAIRFEPGDEKEVELVPFGGTQEIYGFNGLMKEPLERK